MAETTSPSRTGMSARERMARSRLTQLISGQGFIRGCLVERYRLCGKANCRCTRGQKHRGVSLMAGGKGRLEQLFIPREYEAQVRQWVDNYHQIKGLMEQLSQLHWQQVKHRKR